VSQHTPDTGQAGVHADVGLLERDDALAALARHLASARGGSGRMVLLAGEAGVGKTALLRAFSREPDATSVFWGYCDPLSEPRPFGPFVDIALQLGWRDDEALVSVPRSALFTRLLTRLSDRPGSVVVIEDVHWADDATLDLIRFIGRRAGDHPVLFLVSHRDDELGRAHPLRAVLGDLARASAVERLRLPPFGLPAVELLCEGSGHDPRQVMERTGGNPFFVTELLAAPESAGVPGKVSDAVLARCSRLTPAAHEALEMAAVVGARASTRLLDELLAGQGSAVDECLVAGVLVVAGTDVSFRHELARRAVLEAVPPARRARLHATVLRVLRRAPQRGSALAALVHHAHFAGDDEAVLELAPDAGQYASAAGSHRQAAGHYRMALRRADLMTRAQEASLLEALALQCAAIDELDEAVAARRRAIELCRLERDRLGESRNLAHLTGLDFNLGLTQDAEDASRSAIELAEPLGVSAELARADRAQATLRMLSRDVHEAVEWAQRAVDLAESLGDAGVLGEALNAIGSARTILDPDHGAEALERSLELARRNSQHVQAANAYGNLGSAFGEVWRVGQADDWLSAGIAFSAQYDLDGQRHYMLAWRALVLVKSGRLDEAGAAATEALSPARVGTITRIMGLLALGLLRTRRGDPGGQAALDEALELAERTDALQRVAPVRAARAEAAWLAGDAETAGQEASAAYALAFSKQHAAFTGELGYWMWKAGRDVALPDWAAPQFALQVAGRPLEAAEVWQRLGCPYERLRALSEADETSQLEALAGFTTLGARPAADVLRHELRRKGVRRIPRGPRESARTNPWGLSRRELQVLELVTDGLSNDQIARQLVLSTRTVEHHVSAVLQKLGAASRGEAAALLQRGRPRERSTDERSPDPS
jgi:DNA-binding CsgD family transcriptional regulator